MNKNYSDNGTTPYVPQSYLDYKRMNKYSNKYGNDIGYYNSNDKYKRDYRDNMDKHKNRERDRSTHYDYRDRDRYKNDDRHNRLDRDRSRDRDRDRYRDRDHSRDYNRSRDTITSRDSAGYNRIRERYDREYIKDKKIRSPSRDMIKSNGNNDKMNKNEDKNEEQIRECPNWLSKGCCANFRECQYFHDGVECQTWVEYGKCVKFEKGNCEGGHHRSIWKQNDVIPTTNNGNDGNNGNKDSKYKYNGSFNNDDDNVSISSLDSNASVSTKELHKIRINVIKLIKKRREIGLNHLFDQYYDFYGTKMNIDIFGFLNIVSFVKTIKCLCVATAINGKPIIIYRSNKRNRKYK